MKEILLTSEEKVKGLTAISDNIEGKYLLPAIREAQDIYLQEIIGQPLLNALKQYVEHGTSGAFNNSFNSSFRNGGNENPAYKLLLEKLQYYLAYKAVAELIPKVSFKVTNMGSVKTSDDNVQNAGLNEIILQRDYYISRADYYCLMLQNFLLENKNNYPALTECKINQIRATLKSAASCGIFLGGARGKRVK